MNMPFPRLAIDGGPAAVTQPMRPYAGHGQEEIDAVVDVLRNGELSGFLGAWSDRFWGGPQVRALEREWAERFGTRHAISVNSATSALSIALAAARVGPGDEVIVAPHTMSADASCVLAYGGIPVFADLEEETYNLDPASVLANVTPRTRAILVTNWLGHVARVAELRAIADRHGIVLIEDNAQAPLATEYDRLGGTIGHIGVFSLNVHKHIQTGEGGVCTTDDDELAQRMAIVRNHGENVVEPLGVDDLTNLIGFNYRMTEMTAALARVQLRHIDRHVAPRAERARALSAAVAGLDGLRAPRVRPGCRHVSYIWALRYDAAAVGVSRARFMAALAAEGFPTMPAARPLYLLPVFQRRIAIGSAGFPFTLTTRTYERGLCPVAERLERELIFFLTCAYDADPALTEQFGAALRKVHAARAALADSVPA
jgi:dTDP-4-amino-4,6-dideoxygalactose transaminase